MAQPLKPSRSGCDERRVLACSGDTARLKMGPDDVTAGVSALVCTRAASGRWGEQRGLVTTTDAVGTLHATVWLGGSMPSPRDIGAPHVWRHTPDDACAEWLRTSLPWHEPVSGSDVERDALHDVACAFARLLIREEVCPRPG